MKAKIKPRDEISNNRQRLEDKIPLNTPFLILIDPSDKCNFRCKFCPTSDLKLMQATDEEIMEIWILIYIKKL